MNDQAAYGLDPHHEQTVLTAGEPLDSARAAMIMVHGRGARAEDILSLSPQLRQPGLAFLAPQAAGNVWYPNRFIAPISSNEPWLSSALSFIDRVLSQVSAAGIAADSVFLLGFSQGACLALEYAARNPRRYAGVIGLSGGLIGPDGEPRDYPGSLAATPVFLGCSDVDFHIPKERIEQTAITLKKMGAEVTKRLYPNMEHTVNEDEIAFVQGMIQAL
jgi:phospholipase/carboxylesterase